VNAYRGLLSVVELAYYYESFARQRIRYRHRHLRL
jgi:hypothetical protein